MAQDIGLFTTQEGVRDFYFIRDDEGFERAHTIFLGGNVNNTTGSRPSKQDVEAFSAWFEKQPKYKVTINIERFGYSTNSPKFTNRDSAEVWLKDTLERLWVLGVIVNGYVERD